VCTSCTNLPPSYLPDQHIKPLYSTKTIFFKTYTNDKSTVTKQWGPQHRIYHNNWTNVDRIDDIRKPIPTDGRRDEDRNQVKTIKCKICFVVSFFFWIMHYTSPCFHADKPFLQYHNNKNRIVNRFNSTYRSTTNLKFADVLPLKRHSSLWPLTCKEPLVSVRSIVIIQTTATGSWTSLKQQLH